MPPMKPNKEASHQGRRTDLVDNNESDINEVDRPTGTSAAYALRKLRADRPDIHARMLARRTRHADADHLDGGFGVFGSDRLTSAA
jgi:hypothetical protein